MFKGPMLNMDKFIHMFVQNLGLKIEAPLCKSTDKIAFITYVDRACRIKQQLLYTLEKIKEIYMKQNLDLSDEKSVQYFIEKHTNFVDKFILLNNTRILATHLKNINTKILQKVRARRKHVENSKKVEPKVISKNVSWKKKIRVNIENKLTGSKKHALLPISYKEKHSVLHKRNKYKKVTVLENTKTSYYNVATLNKDTDILRVKDSKPSKYNMQNSAMNIVKKEVKMAEKFLWLCIQDVECIKKKVEIILYITKKNNCPDSVELMEYNQILCRHAILCLIEPSKKAFVFLEDNLSVTIKKYLSKGYKYQFEFQRDSQDYYTALIILSQWAKVLLKHINTTMMHTICGILGCDAEDVLVLYSPEEK
ncbi:uncharacterized protein LOC143178265 [Calliopsis andreniformis]|uniref:uncharacterized protein LOC143178265 n=1 Tax=Calliopsis andreniformis TaxID=337506 RepID=UPI003FCED779